MDKLGLQGRVTVFQEDTDGEREYIIENQRNHFTDGMLRGLLSFMVGNYISTRDYSGNSIINAWYYNWNILLGTDTVTPTTHTMSSLVAPISTNPNTRLCEGFKQVADDHQYINWTAVWNAGTISGNVGEMGLYFSPFTNITPLWTHTVHHNTIYNYPTIMCSRLSTASEDFTQFTIDNSRSLTITWTTEVRYV